MPRLLFEKRGNSIYISHLDLMRMFQRAFKRASLPLKHTQGFNPRPSVSIALPLSVGVESGCELLDFDLDGEAVSNDQVKEQLNKTLVEGIRVLDVYDDGRKIRDLTFLESLVTLEYDAGIPDDAEEKIRQLFSGESVVVEKKGKNGIQQQDIIPMLRKLSVTAADDHTLVIRALAYCQNPSLNPMQLSAAIEKYLPEYEPDFSKCTRVEIYDGEEKIFR